MSPFIDHEMQLVSKSRIAMLCVPFLVLLGLTGCSTFNLEYDRLALGSTSREQVEHYFGESSLIDTDSIGGMQATRYAYRFKDAPRTPPEQLRGLWQVPRKELVFEFVNDTLYGYLFNNSVDRRSTNFRDHLRGKILIGHATKTTVSTLLGEPAGKVLLPTTLFSHKLFGHLAHVVPTIANEGWCYYYDYFYYRIGLRRRFEYYKFLVVYFNSTGIVVDKFYGESDKTEPRTTRIFAN